MRNAADTYPFAKMHGLGNDFLVFDRRDGVPPLTPALARAMADRHFGVGCDQVVEIDRGDDEADARLNFWNADGTRSGTCGNATRCIAHDLIAEAGGRPVRIRTERGLLEARATDRGTEVNMGPPILDWRGIPLARDVDVDVMPIEGSPAATGMGNPHCTFFVEDADTVDLACFGPAHEHHPLFPERTNVQVAHAVGTGYLRVRVWERGAGITLASGSSSCAAAVAAHRRGFCDRRVTVGLDGGDLLVDWRDDGVWTAGPTATVAHGAFTAAFLREHA